MGIPVPAFSFEDVQATIVGPGGSIGLANGSGAAEEGISIEFVEETGNMVVGADGSVAQSLRATRAAKVTFRFLKNSPTNAALSEMYALQRTSSLLYGNSTLNIVNIVTGDDYTGQQVAFARAPRNTYKKDQEMLEWEFNVGQMDFILGSLGVLTSVI